MAEPDAPDDWQKTWDARLTALEAEFGPSESNILHSSVPIYLGGGADVLTFRQHVQGFAYVTAGLIGGGAQQKTDMGEYELMMCARQGNDWMPSLMSRLAPYTFDAALEHGQTMDIAPAMPEGSTIAALLFVDYRKVQVNEEGAGVLLCIGITDDELEHCRENGPDHVLGKLKEKMVFPFTDPVRKSVLGE